MNFSRACSVLALTLCLGGAVACGSASVETAQSAQAPLSRAPLATTTPVMGPMKPLVEAFADVPLAAAQRSSIEKELTDALARHKSMHAARVEIATTLAGQVEAGAIDRSAIAAKFDAMAAEHDKVAPEDHAALERVHALLDPSQRAAFVDALGARVTAGFAGHAGKGDHGDHHAPMGRGHEGMKRFADELGLSEEQRGRIRDAMQARHAEHAPPPDGAPMPAADPAAHAEHARGRHGGWHPGAMHERWEKFASAFKSDHFVMSELAPPAHERHAMAGMGMHMVDLVEAALPTLTPEQRTKAAAMIRERAARGDGPEGH